MKLSIERCAIAAAIGTSLGLVVWPALSTLLGALDLLFAESHTTFGSIGVKVWVYKGEIFKKDEKQDAGVLLKKKKSPFEQ